MNNRTQINEHSSSASSSYQHRQLDYNPYNDRGSMDRQNIQKQYMVLKQKVEGRIKQLQSRCAGASLNMMSNMDSNQTRVTINTSHHYNGNNGNNSNSINNTGNAQIQSQGSQTKIKIQPLNNNRCANNQCIHTLQNNNNQCKYCSIQQQYAKLKKQQQQQRQSDGRTQRQTYASTNYQNGYNNNTYNNRHQQYQYNNNNRYQNNINNRNLHSQSMSSQNSVNNNGYLAPTTIIESQYQQNYNSNLESKQTNCNKNNINANANSSKEKGNNTDNIIIREDGELNNSNNGNNINNINNNLNNKQKVSGFNPTTLPIHSKNNQPLPIPHGPHTPHSSHSPANRFHIPNLQYTKSITTAYPYPHQLQNQLQNNNINGLSLNQALLSNMILQQQMNNNLKVLNDRLSDLSVKRSDSSQFVDDNRSRAHSKDGQFYINDSKMKRSNSKYNQYQKYNDNNTRQHQHYHHSHNHNHHHHQHHKYHCKQCQHNNNNMQHRHNRNNSHRSKSTTKRYVTQSAQYPHQKQYVQQRRAQQYQNYINNNSNNNVEEDGNNVGINVNRIDRVDRNRVGNQSVGHKFKSSTQHFDRHRIQSYKDNDKNAQSGRAKSVSARSSSSKNSHRQLGVIRVIKDNTNSKSTKKQYDRNRNSNSSKKLDSQYFVRKRSPHHHHTHTHNHHHSSNLKTDISNTKYMPMDPKVYQHYCPLHTTNQVMRMYEHRAKTRNNQIYRDSQYRNMKHQKQHIMQAFQQQQRARKQLLSKISKNFFTTYGVK